MLEALVIEDEACCKRLHVAQFRCDRAPRLGTLALTAPHPTQRPRLRAALRDTRVAAGDLVVVSPDVGGVARARAFAKKLSDAPLAIVDKRRSAHNVSEVMNIIGDVRGKVAVLVDDMIDTAGTITNAARVLHTEGAKAVYACATHAVFSPPAVERLSSGAQRIRF